MIGDTMADNKPNVHQISAFLAALEKRHLEEQNNSAAGMIALLSLGATAASNSE
jgi:hypothetical protein